MAIVALVLWVFTAGAGFYLLVTSNLARTRPSAPAPLAESAPLAEPVSVAESAPLAEPVSVAESAPLAEPVSVAQAAPLAEPMSVAQAATADPASPRDLRRAARTRWDPPSLVAARQAPVLPGLRSLLEFAHPAFAIIGLAFWLSFTLVHNKALGWIAFGLIAATASLGLAWFTANLRAARRPTRGRVPHFAGRLLVVHGSAAALTVILSAVTALVTRG